MKRTVKEALDEIQANPECIVDYKDSSMMQILFDYAFAPSRKFLLPEGVPPYREDQSPFGMSPGNFQQELKKFYIFTRVDLAPLRRETIFIQMLEGFHPSEAKILLALKEQNLAALYPAITHEFVYKHGLTTVVPDVPLVEFEKKEIAVVAETKSLEPEVEPVVTIDKPVKVRGKPGPKPGWLKKKLEEAARLAHKITD